jgi:hypothetical protein
MVVAYRLISPRCLHWSIHAPQIFPPGLPERLHNPDFQFC